MKAWPANVFDMRICSLAQKGCNIYEYVPFPNLSLQLDDSCYNLHFKELYLSHKAMN